MVTNENVNFLEISTLSTDFSEENYSLTAVHWCSIGTFVLHKFLKNKHKLSKMWPFDFEKNKKIIQNAYSIFQGYFGRRKKNQGFCANEIKQKSGCLVQQFRCYNQLIELSRFNPI